ncbi:MAG: hypothetical protein B6I36_02950 [Desulfobacteraceae bacterium 4572_35.1]|nr:MAG: hypothetical protein B6I36_02950 [Desulfobacteraceae bacterium 4572_35.1]
MTKKHKILSVITASYVLLLLVVAIITLHDFTQQNFGLLFIVITMWPIGRFFLLRNARINAWLNKINQ